MIGREAFTFNVNFHDLIYIFNENPSKNVLVVSII